MTKNINFKAAVLTEQKKPLELLTNVKVPILKEGQILVKLAYSGVCHSQIMEIDGHRGEDKFLPHLLGHEGSGLVVDVGLNVSKIKKDDTVILTWIKGDGLEAGGVKYQSNERVIKFSRICLSVSISSIGLSEPPLDCIDNNCSSNCSISLIASP